MDDRLPMVGTYTLQLSGGSYSITVPLTAPQNTPASKADPLPTYVDYQRGFLVYDLGDLGEGGDEPK
jgi:hypothetical protein